MPKLTTPKELLCPLTRELYQKPVVAEDGNTYEKSAIENRLDENTANSNMRINIGNRLIQNNDKKAQVINFLTKNNVCSFEDFIKAIYEALNSRKLESLQALNYLDYYLNHKDKMWRIPLHIAVDHSFGMIAEWLLAEGADPCVNDDEGVSALHLAKNPEVAKRLLAKGIYVNVRDNIKRTPLHYAAIKGLPNMVKTLLAEGADSEARDKDNNMPIAMIDLVSPYQFELYEENYDKVSYLLLANSSNLKTRHGSLLHLAIAHRQVDEVKQILWGKQVLGDSVNLEAVDHTGSTPLHLAAVKGLTKIVKWLLAEGAKLEAKRTDGRTPLHCAAYCGHEEVVSLLLQKGANYKAQDNAGQTPGQVAEIFNKSAIVKLIQVYEAPERLGILQSIIQEQQKRINILEQQLANLLAQMQPVTSEQPKTASVPAFFKK